jgi:hypothetical protein
MTNEDIGSHLHYDEQVATETYVLRNYAHLLTDAERAELDGGLSHWWEHNLERMHEWGAKLRFWKEPPAWKPEPVDEAHYARVQAIVQRLQATHGDEIWLARCPKCNRIGRTAQDDQCPWCLTKLR